MSRRASVFLLVTILAAGVIYAWIGFGGAELPPGVSARDWKPIASDLGLVVQNLSAGKLGGYLMMKVDGQWKRVVVYDPNTVGLLPAH